MILKHGEGERQEIDLVAPKPAAPQELPTPLCPMGLPSDGDPEAEHEEVSPPGVSPLDDGLRRLEDGLRSEGGEAS